MALVRRLLHVSSRCGGRASLSSCPRGGVCGNASRCEFRYAIDCLSYSAYASCDPHERHVLIASGTTTTNSRPPSFAPPPRTIKDLFRQSSPRAPGTSSFAEAWCQDAGTYPIIVIMGIATLLCTASVFHHTRMPTTTWNIQGA